MNVLFADGRVEWIDEPQAKHLLAELSAGHNPPRPLPVKAPATRPVTGPAQARGGR